jgi:folate-binding protein YgfZ
MRTDPLSMDVLSQYEQLHDRAGVLDASDRTRIELTGVDRAGFLHGFCTNHIKRLLPGTGCEAFLTNVKGRVIGHAFVFCHPDSLVLNTVAGQSDSLLRHLDRYLIREDVQLTDGSGTWDELLVSGVGAVELLQEATGVGVPAEYLSHITCPLADCDITIRRVRLALAPSFLLQCPAGSTAEVIGCLEGGGLARCDRQLLEIVRIEAKMPCYGVDITAENLPQEIDRDAQAISFAKGCYLGQETVARIDALGHVNRTLVQVQWQGGQVPQPGLQLESSGQEVGRVTSAVWSPRCRAPLGLALVRSGCAQPGRTLESACGDAAVVDLPAELKPWNSEERL